MSLSTHVLDSSTGKPAAGVAVRVEHRSAHGWYDIATATTDADGRVSELAELSTGVHRISFATGDYFAARGVPTFYPEIMVLFEVIDPEQHHHVPLLLSPFAYSTYRGS
jgi:5-hydroxyisourate hydrolase